MLFFLSIKCYYLSKKKKKNDTSTRGLHEETFQCYTRIHILLNNLEPSKIAQIFSYHYFIFWVVVGQIMYERV
jgi:hypothetical protein